MRSATRIAAALTAAFTAATPWGQAVQASAEDGPYWLYNAHSGKCLTVQGASTAQSARAIQHPCEGRNAPHNEEWLLL
ncbi:MAG TPA: RICIN domain-containing protein [Actinoplanes sp.]|jgi:hypothetical protein